MIVIPVFSDGIFLQIPNGNFTVAEACAGLRFLVATLALGLLFANAAYQDWWRRSLFMVLVLVVPVIANGFRALGIVQIGRASWRDRVCQSVYISVVDVAIQTTNYLFSLSTSQISAFLYT